jgi:hypothetical protein
MATWGELSALASTVCSATRLLPRFAATMYRRTLSTFSREGWPVISVDQTVALDLDELPMDVFELADQGISPGASSIPRQSE